MRTRLRARRFRHSSSAWAFAVTLGLATCLATPFARPARADAAPLLAPLVLDSSFPPHYSGRLTFIQDPESGDLTAGHYEDNQNIENFTHTLDEIRQGVSVFSFMGRRIVSLRAPGFDSREGGTVIVTYRREFFADDVRTLFMQCVRQADGSWSIQTHDPAGPDPVDRVQLKIEMNLVGLPVGIERVTLTRSGSIVRDYPSVDLGTCSARPGVPCL